MSNRIYISGAVTGTDDYIQRFKEAEGKLREMLYSSELWWIDDIINPITVNEMLPKSYTHEEYMRVSIAMLSTCRAIYMLEGYEKSAGAIEELAYALDNNMTVYIEYHDDNKPSIIKQYQQE